MERSFAANIFNVKPQFIWLKTPVCNLLKIRMIPFTFQKTAFQPLKGHLLERKRCPFGMQKDTFRKTAGHVWAFMPYFMPGSYVSASLTNLSCLLYYKPPLPLLWKRRGREVMEEGVKY